MAEERGRVQDQRAEEDAEDVGVMAGEFDVVRLLL